jgi:hypothetical protein
MGSRNVVLVIVVFQISLLRLFDGTPTVVPSKK